MQSLIKHEIFYYSLSQRTRTPVKEESFGPQNEHKLFTAYHTSNDQGLGGYKITIPLGGECGKS